MYACIIMRNVQIAKTKILKRCQKDILLRVLIGITFKWVLVESKLHLASLLKCTSLFILHSLSLSFSCSHTTTRTYVHNINSQPKVVQVPNNMATHVPITNNKTELNCNLFSFILHAQAQDSKQWNTSTYIYSEAGTNCHVGHHHAFVVRCLCTT